MRTLVRWAPYSDIRSLRHAMNRAFDDGVRTELRPQELTFAIDLSDTDEAVVLKAALPGINPEDVDISVNDGVLTIKGETKSEQTDESRNFYRQEIRYGSFSRSITLPVLVNDEQAEATFENGVLTVTLPKAEEARPKQIKVTSTKTLEAPTPSAN